MPPSAKPTIKCKFPSHYVPHLERFLWHYYLFYALHKYFQVKRNQLDRFGIGFFERILVMMDQMF